MIVAKHDGLWTAVALVRPEKFVNLKVSDNRRVEVHLTLPEVFSASFKVVIWHGSSPDLKAFAKRVKASPPPPLRKKEPTKPRWTQTITTPLEVGVGEGPFAVDTITLPYENPYKSLFFVTGLDFHAERRCGDLHCAWRRLVGAH